MASWKQVLLELLLGSSPTTYSWLHLQPLIRRAQNDASLLSWSGTVPESPGCREHGCPKLFCPEWMRVVGEGRASVSKMVNTKLRRRDTCLLPHSCPKSSSNSLALRDRQAVSPFSSLSVSQGGVPAPALGRTTRGNILSHAKRQQSYLKIRYYGRLIAIGTKEIQMPDSCWLLDAFKMNHLCDWAGVGGVHAQTVLERVDKPEVCHTSSYNSHGEYLEMISLLMPVVVKMPHSFRILSVVKGTTGRTIFCVGRSFMLLFLIICVHISVPP